MQLELRNSLLYTSVKIGYQGKSAEIGNIVIDTGSGATLLTADLLETIGITPQFDDSLHIIRGVGGREMVFSRKVDYLQVGEKKVEGFEIEVGGMNYGFEINGILGLDFLLKSGAVINLYSLELSFG